MTDAPVLVADSRWPQWMVGHRLAGAIALGVTLGLVWGATAGVIVAILMGYGTLTTLSASLPLGVVVIGSPTVFFTNQSLKRVAQSEPQQA